MEKISAEVIGPRLRCLRTHRRMTQADLGERSNLDRSYISKLENGNRGLRVPMTTLTQLAQALDCSLNELIDAESTLSSIHSTDQTLITLWSKMAKLIDTPMIIVSSTGHILEANNSFLTTTGFKEKQIHFINILQWIPTRAVPSSGSIIGQVVLSSGHVRNVNFQFEALTNDLIACKLFFFTDN